MRPIIFRAKRVDNGEWVYGDLSKIHCRVYISQFVLDDTFQDGAENEHLYKHIWVLPETVGQYTGLTDKNGKKIFEGDIVSFEDESPYNYEYHDDIISNAGEVKYADGQFYLTNRIAVKMDDLIYDGVLDGEVIGNVIDNPELLEVGND